MRKRLVIAAVVLCLNFVPFALTPLIGEKMSKAETIFALLTIPPSLMVVFLARDPVGVLLRALRVGLIIIAIGFALRACGGMLIEVGREMQASAEPRRGG